MSYYYLDSSALVKRYLTETGSFWIAALTDSAVGNTIVVAEITRVEVAAALAARQRASAGIILAERDRLVTLFLQHCDTEYMLVPLNNQIYDQAVRLTQQHRLRGYDAVQLAVTRDINTLAIAAGLSALTFTAADDDLLVAARAAGLAAENPNLHP
jgi:hypothetical protein